MLDRFKAGAVRGPFGVKGFAKVMTFSGETEHLASVRWVTLRKDGVEKTIAVEASSGSGPSFALKFKGYDSPETVKALTGWEILLPREEAAPLEEGEFYIEDLRGAAVLLEGAKIGEIFDIVEGGGSQLVEITLLDGTKRFVPLLAQFFGDIDPKAGTAQLLVGWILE